MSISPRPLSAQYGQEVARLVQDAELGLLRLIAKALRAGDQAELAWVQSKLAELQLLRRRATVMASSLDADLAAEIHRVVLEAYNSGSALAVRDLDRAKVDARLAPDPTGTARAMAQQITADVHGAVAQLPDTLANVYRRAVNAGVDEVLGGAVTRRGAAQHVLDDLLSDGITGFTDTAGRNWALDTFVEMAVRTGTAAAAISGHVDTLQASGQDLVIVSTSPASCPVCDEWEGKILSTSGDVAGGIFPDVTGGDDVEVDVAGSLQDATAAGLFHPNCTHSIDAYLPGATDAAPDAGDAPSADAVDAAQSSDGDSEYQAKQRQRDIERTIRSWKRRDALALDDSAAERASAKVTQWQAALRQHLADNPTLKRQSAREQIGLAH